MKLYNLIDMHSVERRSREDIGLLEKTHLAFIAHKATNLRESATFSRMRDNLTGEVTVGIGSTAIHLERSTLRGTRVSTLVRISWGDSEYGPVYFSAMQRRDSPPGFAEHTVSENLFYDLTGAQNTLSLHELTRAVWLAQTLDATSEVET